MRFDEVQIEGATLKDRKVPEWIAEIVRWLPLWVAATTDAEIATMHVYHGEDNYFIQKYEGRIVVQFVATTNNGGMFAEFGGATAAKNFILQHCRYRTGLAIERMLRLVGLEMPEELSRKTKAPKEMAKKDT